MMPKHLKLANFGILANIGTTLKSKDSRSVLVKSAKSATINFETTFRGRNEVQKNKPTTYCLTEFHGESEINNRFSPREFSF